MNTHTPVVLALSVVFIVACGGDDPLPPPPPQVSAGPVTIDTATLTLTLASDPPLVSERFVAIGTVPTVDATHY